LWSKGVKVPVLGVQGAGKTCFFASMAHCIAQRGWGVPDDETFRYVAGITHHLVEGTPLAVTTRPRRLSVRLSNCHLPGRGDVRCNITLTSEDFDGQVWGEIVEAWSDPGSEVAAKIERFADVVANSDSLVVILDVVGQEPATWRKSARGIDDQLTNQLVPICSGIDLVLQRRKRVPGYLVSFLVTKADIHRISQKELEERIKVLFAFQLGRLRALGAEWVVRPVVAVGHIRDSFGRFTDRMQGIDEVLQDIVARFGP
jgi:hypothetical protein